jgi:hypothetical protein
MTGYPDPEDTRPPRAANHERPPPARAWCTPWALRCDSLAAMHILPWRSERDAAACLVSTTRARRVTGLLMLLALSMACDGSKSAAAEEQRLIGTWVNSSFGTISFQADHSGVLSDSPITSYEPRNFTWKLNSSTAPTSLDIGSLQAIIRFEGDLSMQIEFESISEEGSLGRPSSFTEDPRRIFTRK